jgi:hypothetical protein
MGCHRYQGCPSTVQRLTALSDGITNFLLQQNEQNRKDSKPVALPVL